MIVDICLTPCGHLFLKSEIEEEIQLQEEVESRGDYSFDTPGLSVSNPLYGWFGQKSYTMMNSYEFVFARNVVDQRALCPTCQKPLRTRELRKISAKEIEKVHREISDANNTTAVSLISQAKKQAVEMRNSIEKTSYISVRILIANGSNRSLTLKDNSTGPDKVREGYSLPDEIKPDEAHVVVFEGKSDNSGVFSYAIEGTEKVLAVYFSCPKVGRSKVSVKVYPTKKYNELESNSQVYNDLYKTYVNVNEQKGIRELGSWINYIMDYEDPFNPNINIHIKSL